METLYIALGCYTDHAWAIKANNNQEFFEKLVSVLPGNFSDLVNNRLEIVDETLGYLKLNIWDIFLDDFGNETDEKLLAFPLFVYILSNDSPDIVELD